MSMRAKLRQLAINVEAMEIDFYRSPRTRFMALKDRRSVRPLQAAVGLQPLMFGGGQEQGSRPGTVGDSSDRRSRASPANSLCAERETINSAAGVARERLLARMRAVGEWRLTPSN